MNAKYEWYALVVSDEIRRVEKFRGVPSVFEFNWHYMSGDHYKIYKVDIHLMELVGIAIS